MTTIEARYIDGSSVKVSKVESVSDIMVYFAKMHKQFASDVVVVCADTGKLLSDASSQIPPSVVQVALKQETERTDQDLLLTLRLHSMREDDATCVLAYYFLQKQYNEEENGWKLILETILDEVLEAGACGDAKIEQNILRTLIRLGVNANYFLQEAAGNGNEGRLRMLLAEGVPIQSTYSDDTNACDIPALSAAAWEGRADIVEILLAHSADINCNGHAHELPSIPKCDKPFLMGTPLILAVYNGHVDVVKVLIDHKADVNKRNMSNWPLNAACSEGHIDVVRVLLSHGADINYAIRFDNAPIMWAAQHGNVDLAKLLLSHKAKIDFFDENKNTPIHKVLNVYKPDDNFCGKVEVLKLLIAHQASVNTRNPESTQTALLTALHDNRMKDAVKLLLDHKADANTGNVRGDYPLLVAAKKGDADTVNLLLAHKADPNLNNVLKTAIADASKRNDRAVLEILEPLNAISVEENQGTRCLRDKSALYDQCLIGGEEELLYWTLKRAQELQATGALLRASAVKLMSARRLYDVDTTHDNKELKDQVAKVLLEKALALAPFLRECLVLCNALNNPENKSEGESGSCSETFVNKRLKTDETIGKDSYVPTQDFAKKREGLVCHSSCSEDKNSKENADEDCGLDTFTSKDEKVL
eukprot:GEMP01019212.1.p1 GENE.GEMP01019212.1~~GEMP01019212.1.p1  ORF type:complete len:647 (-),score=55.42 GEMP01019212.1:692-2632(-)